MDKYKLNSSEVILIIIDLQENLMKAMKVREKVCKNTNLLLALAKEFDIPVLITEQYPRGLGTTVQEIRDNIPTEHYYLEKNSFSAFTGEMEEIINTARKKTFIITGSETHVCVFQTVRDLINAGYNVHLVRDAVCSRFDENYENGLSLMKDLGAVITNAETVIFDILKVAGTKEFKAISPLLK